METIGQKLIRELFDYVDGKLIWKSPTSNRVSVGDEAGYTCKRGYVQVGIGGKIYLAHRLIYLWHNGYIPDEIDHIDRDKSNNKIENLRSADRTTNSYNRGEPAHNTSGVKGVSLFKNGKYRAYLHTEGKQLHLGLFDTIEEASSARAKAEVH